MAVYWIMLAIPSLLAFIFKGEARRGRLLDIGAAILVAILFAALIGLRYKVGADWGNYEAIQTAIHFSTFSEATSFGDAGYSAAAWISDHLGFGVYGVNLLCSILLVIGVFRFCRQQPDFWLSVASAVPYLLIVVGMGYVRQGGAMGLVLLALAAQERGSTIRAFAWLLPAAFIHASSVFVAVLIFGNIAWRRPGWLILGLVAIGAFAVLLAERIRNLLDMYVAADMDSSGAVVRLAMNIVPALIYLAVRRRLPLLPQQRSLWTLFALASVGTLAVLPFNSTTAIDRIAIYLIPIQLFLFGRLAQSLARSPAEERLLTLLCVAYFAATQFIWLFFATHAQYWLPYRFYPWEVLDGRVIA